MSEIITPGYVWYQGAPVYEGASHMAFLPQERHNLREEYPIPDVASLQSIWDGKNVQPNKSQFGPGITTVEFNSSAEKGTIIWLPGWGVSSLRDGGARVAVAMAALNPDMRIVTAEEVENPSVDIVMNASTGNMLPYAKQYARLVEGVSGPVFMAGHSRGAVIQTLLAAHGYAEPVALSVMDAPGYRDVRPAIKFGARAALLDNLVQRHYMKDPHQVDTAAEAKLEAIDLGDFEPDTPLKAMLRAKRQWHLIQAMSHTTMPEALGRVAESGNTNTFIWHGTKNVGTPINSARQTVHSLQARFPGIVSYFESTTGHYSAGHTARFARQTAFVVERSLTSIN